MKEEFVMAPRDLLQRAIDQLSVCSGPGPANRAQELRALLAHPAEQHQGEPVTLPEPMYHSELAFSDDRNRLVPGWNACLDEIAKLGPLYTHADPAEVERLRAELVEWKERCQRNNHEAMTWMRKHDVLRTKLAEMLETARGLTIQIHSFFGNTEHHPDCKRDLEELSHPVAALSASAEPSAPDSFVPPSAPCAGGKFENVRFSSCSGAAYCPPPRHLQVGQVTEFKSLDLIRDELSDEDRDGLISPA